MKLFRKKAEGAWKGEQRASAGLSFPAGLALSPVICSLIGNPRMITALWLERALCPQRISTSKNGVFKYVQADEALK